MAKLTLQNILSGYLSQATYNANNAAIISAFTNTLSRDGTTPNEMGVSLDMNSFNINNVGNINVTSLTIDGVPILPPLASGVTTLSGLTDVSDATPTVGNILIGTGTDWESAPLSAVASDIAVSQDDITVDANATRLNFTGDVVTVTQQSPGVVDIDVQTPDPLIYGGIIGGIQWWPGITPPNTDWVYCNGQSLDTTNYADLFAVIGYAFGGSGASFNVPDLRGKFIRGWDNGAGNDPDAASRTDRGDGTTGDNIGTQQADQFKSHNHTFSTGNNDNVGSIPDGAIDITSSGSTNSSGGLETRPKNVVFMPIMRAFLSAGSGTVSGGSFISVEDEGSALTAAVKKINFIGASVTASEPVADEIDVTISGSSQWELISTTTVSGDPSQIDLTWDENTYSDIRVVVEGVQPATDGVTFRARFGSADGATIYTGAGEYEGMQRVWEGTGAFAALANTTRIDLGPSSSNAANETINVTIEIMCGRDSNLGAAMRATMQYINSSSNQRVLETKAFLDNVSASVDTLRLYFATGNFANVGTIRVYGLNN